MFVSKNTLLLQLLRRKLHWRATTLLMASVVCLFNQPQFCSLSFSRIFLSSINVQEILHDSTDNSWNRQD